MIRKAPWGKNTRDWTALPSLIPHIFQGPICWSPPPKHFPWATTWRNLPDFQFPKHLTSACIFAILILQMCSCLFYKSLSSFNRDLYLFHICSQSIGHHALVHSNHVTNPCWETGCYFVLGLVGSDWLSLGMGLDCIDTDALAPRKMVLSSPIVSGRDCVTGLSPKTVSWSDVWLLGHAGAVRSPCENPHLIVSHHSIPEATCWGKGTIKGSSHHIEKRYTSEPPDLYQALCEPGRDVFVTSSHQDLGVTLLLCHNLAQIDHHWTKIQTLW